MESALYSMWRVDVRNLVRSKLYICRDYHIQPSEIDRMVYFEFEYIIEDVNKEAKEQEKKNKEEQKQYESMRKGTSSYKTPQAPKMPSMPKVSIPKF